MPNPPPPLQKRNHPPAPRPAPSNHGPRSLTWGLEVGGGEWVKNGTRSGNFCIFPGPIFPIFPQGHQFRYRAVNKKKVVSKYPVDKWPKFEVSRDIQKIGYFLGLLQPNIQRLQHPIH